MVFFVKKSRHSDTSMR